MEYYGKEEQIKVETKRRLEYIKCDECNSKIKVNEKYYDVMTSHGDWGNDSVDSIKHNDICSKCITKFVDKKIEEYKNSYTNNIQIEAETYNKRYEYYDDFENMLVEDDNLI